MSFLTKLKEKLNKTNNVSDLEAQASDPVETSLNDAEDDLLLNDEEANSSKSNFLTKLKEKFNVSKDKPKYASIPIRVIIGYLPEVSERDAKEYAIGIAEKHFEQLGMAYFFAYPYNNGFVFEVHEGGDGRGFVPSILNYFDAQGLYKMGEKVTVTIKTATRLVEVQRTREGLVAIILPENTEKEQSSWLEPTIKMTQALNRRTGFLIAGAVFFVSGFTAMMASSFLTRFQPYEEAPVPSIEQISYDQLPSSQWNKLVSVYAPSYVKALRFKNGKWEPPEIAIDNSSNK